MNDLISRQAVLEATSAKLKITGKENAETVYGYIKKLCDDIKALPSIDAVEVVRCKDCVYGEHDSEASDEKMDWYFCNYTGGNWNLGKQFCSYGERKIND